MPSHERQPEVYTISGTRTSLDDDLGLRMRRYLISMSVRTVCFVLAVVFDGWVRWVFVAAAIVLPYVAVVAANAGRSHGPSGPTPYTPPQQAIEGDRADRLEQ
ncbi:MAG: DUF3099 domain-containing protein [Pseudonocardia sp.]